jgi:hypothetical protein
MGEETRKRDLTGLGDLRLFKIPIFQLRVAASPPLSTEKLGLYFFASPLALRMTIGNVLALLPTRKGNSICDEFQRNNCSAQ